MSRPFALRLLPILGGFLLSAAARSSAHEYIQESNGHLAFPADANGYRIPDYSYAGYMNSNQDLPAFGTEYVAEVSLSSPSGDETARLQAAIDAVSTLTPNESGYRGAVVLGAGTWNVSSELTIDASGVVIRGEGIDSTIIQWTAGYTNQIFKVSSVPTSNPPDQFDDGRDGTHWNITTAVVDVGDMSFDVEGGHTLQIGDRIIIEHPCTAEWVTAVDNGGVTVDPPWPVDENPIRYYRHVTDIAGNTITIDAPVFYSLVRANSQSFVFEYTQTTTQFVGFENLTIDADTSANSQLDDNPKFCINFNRSEDCWVRNVRTQNFRSAGFYNVESSRITIQDCEAIDPHSIITSAHRYNFNNRGGQLILVKDCYSRKGRHNLVSAGWAMDSGNVWLRCTVDDNYAAAEDGHQRWSNGTLFDNCLFRQVSAPEVGKPYDLKMFWAGNHGDNSAAHGWAGVTTTVYKCTFESPGYAIIAKPPTGMNYEIDSVGDIRSVHSAWGDFPGALDISTTGTLPSSLFEAQLLQRLGEEPPPIPGNVDLSIASLDFGFAATNTSTDLQFTVSNHSGGPLAGTVSAESPFSIVSGSAWSLNDTESQIVTVRYTPASAGVNAENLTVSVSGGNDVNVDVVGIAADRLGSLGFNTNAGTLIGPMADGGDYISSSTRDEGFAVYAIDIATAGTYQIETSANAPIDGSNSFFVAFDANPSNPSETWDILPLTSGFEPRVVSHRGLNGTFDNPEFSPATWELAAGTHFLVIQARETDTQLSSISLVRIGASEDLAAPSNLTITPQ